MIQKIENATGAEAMTIIKTITDYDSVTEMKNNLRRLIDHWFIFSNAEEDERKNMFTTFTAINEALTSIEKLKMNYPAAEQRGILEQS